VVCLDGVPGIAPDTPKCTSPAAAGCGPPGGDADHDYRRTDAAAVRLLLRRGPVPVGRLGTALGVTRQAARKAANGLQQRGFATARRDPDDARQLIIALTPTGQD
jgi:DNA-binding MarR family transcriptional regulator